LTGVKPGGFEWRKMMAKPVSEQDRYSWAGPALFIIVLALLTVFFFWFVRA
jgi:hypothetical protein